MTAGRIPFLSLIPALIMGLFLTLSAFAQSSDHALEPAPDVTFGPEFTFTRQDIYDSFPKDRLVIQNDQSVEAIRQWVDRIIEQYHSDQVANLQLVPNPESREPQRLIHEKIVRRRGLVLRTHHRLTFPDGFYFEILPDPGVLEVTTRPGTFSYFRDHADLIQRYLFDSAASLGLTPFDYAGGGHIHIGSVFANDPRLLRDFIVDYFNHPGISDGGLGNDPYNALALPQMSEFQRAAMAEVLRDFDAGLIRTSDELIRAITSRVYLSGPTDPYWASKKKQWFQRQRPTRAFALNFQQLLIKKFPFFSQGFGTVEVRAAFPQKSFAQFLRTIELFARRISQLRQLSEPLSYNQAASFTDPQASLRNFVEYIEQAQMDPTQFQEGLHPIWRANGLRIQSSCEALFRAIP